MIEVELPDGTIAEFPDGTAPDAIKAAISKRYDPEAQRRTEFDARIKREMAMSPEEWETHLTERMEAGEPFRSQPGNSMAGSLFSNAMFDPFGFRDEIVGGGQFIGNLVKSGGDIDKASEAYSNAAGLVRAEQRAARDEYGIVPELIGGFGTTGITKTALSQVPTALQTAKQASVAGAGYGSAAGLGQSEGGVEDRLLGTLKGAATGAVLGPVISNVAVPAIARTVGGLKDAARYATQSVKSARNPEQAGIEQVADKMVASNISPANLRSQVSPPVSGNLQSRGFTETDLADIISRQMAGEGADSVAARYAHLVDTQGRKFTPDTARNYLRRYEELNPTPLNLIDISTKVAGEGGAMPVKRLGRAAQSLAGDEGGDAAQRLMSRQETQPGRVTNIIQRSVADGDFEATRAAGLKNLREEADKAYKAFYKEPDLAINKLDDLMQDPLFKQATEQAQQQARVASIRRNQATTKSGGPQEPVLYTNKNDPQIAKLRGELNQTKDDLRAARRRRQDATSKEEKRVALDEARDHEDAITAIEREIKELSETNPEVYSPELLDLIQRQLRLKSEGFTDPNAAAHARGLREVFLDRIEGFYPTFKGIRKNYAVGKGEFGEEGALEAGRELTTKLGAKASEALRGYGDMTTAQQELFRLGFARRLMDMTADPQIGGAVANKFNTTAVREIVEELYPKSNPALWKQGQKLINDLQTEALTTRNANFQLQGSRTAELGSDMSRLMQGAETAADVATGRWGNLLRNISTRLSTQLGQRGATEVMNILTQTDPAKLLPLLNRLEQAARSTTQRQNLVSPVRQLRTSNRPGTAAVAGLDAENIRRFIAGQ
jgi:hypothetical protein